MEGMYFERSIALKVDDQKQARDQPKCLYTHFLDPRKQLQDWIRLEYRRVINSLTLHILLTDVHCTAP